MRCMGLNVYTAVRYLAIGLVVTLCLASCCKETGDQYFCFCKEGGPILYDVDLDGSSIAVEIDGTLSSNPEYSEDDSNVDNSQWFIEFNWLRATYFPVKQTLYIFVDENSTMRSRKACVSGFQKGKRLMFGIEQGY